MLDEKVETFLAHHGILGMHWGSRKPTTSSSRTSQSSKKKLRLKSSTKKDLKAAAIITGVSTAPYVSLKTAQGIKATRDYGKATVEDMYAKKFAPDAYHQQVKERGYNGEGATKAANKKYKAATDYLAKREAGKNAAKGIGAASVRMSKVGDVWKFVAIGAEDA